MCNSSPPLGGVVCAVHRHSHGAGTHAFARSGLEPGRRRSLHGNLHGHRHPPCAGGLRHSISRFPSRAGIGLVVRTLPVLPAHSRPCRSTTPSRCLPLLGYGWTAGDRGLAGFFLRHASCPDATAARATFGQNCYINDSCLRPFCGRLCSLFVIEVGLFSIVWVHYDELPSLHCFQEICSCHSTLNPSPLSS